MQMHLPVTHTLSAFFFLFVFTSPPFFSCPAAAQNNRNEPQDLLRSSCIHARYPGLCLQTLSNAGPAAMKTPLDLAQAAVKVSLARATTLSDYLKTLQVPSGLSKRQRVELSDCASQMSDSVDELSKSLNELQHLRAGTFQWQMSNAQTWVSAALTDGSTCLDGFNDGSSDGKLRWDVKRRVTDVARLTSNALYLISRLGDSANRSGKPRSGSRN